MNKRSQIFVLCEKTRMDGFRVIGAVDNEVDAQARTQGETRFYTELVEVGVNEGQWLPVPKNLHVAKASVIVLALILSLFAGTARAQSPVDWSFVKDKRTWIGVSFSTAGMIADQRTSRSAESRGAHESNPFLRTDDGRLNIGKHTVIGLALNATMLPADLSPNHKFRWLALAGRVTLGVWWFSRAAHNHGVAR